MVYRKRIYYTDARKAEMWDRWQRGETLHSIARLFDRYHTSVRGILAHTGGIRPRERRRSSHALTLAEREHIPRGIVAGHSVRSIAATLERAPSTVSGEIQRNGGPHQYRASQADQAAWDRAHRPKACKLVINRALTEIVAKKLRRSWSPEQIAGWLKHVDPNDESYRVSHETIYKSLFIQARGALKKEPRQYLRSQRAIRHSRHANQKGNGKGQISNAVFIRERPPSMAGFMGEMSAYIRDMATDVSAIHDKMAVMTTEVSKIDDVVANSDGNINAMNLDINVIQRAMSQDMVAMRHGVESIAHHLAGMDNNMAYMTSEVSHLDDLMDAINVNIHEGTRSFTSPMYYMQNMMR